MSRYSLFILLVVSSLIASCTYDPNNIALTKKDPNTYVLLPCNGPDDCAESESGAFFCCMDPQGIHSGLVPDPANVQKHLGLCRRACISTPEQSETERLCTIETEANICGDNETGKDCYGYNRLGVGHCGVKEKPCHTDGDCELSSQECVIKTNDSPNNILNYQFPGKDVKEFNGICTSDYHTGDICNLHNTNIPKQSDTNLTQIFQTRSKALPVCLSDSFSTMYTNENYGRIVLLCSEDSQCPQDMECLWKSLGGLIHVAVGVCQERPTEPCKTNDDCSPELRCCKAQINAAVCTNIAAMGGDCQYAEKTYTFIPSDGKKDKNQDSVPHYLGLCKDNETCKKINPYFECIQGRCLLSPSL